MLSGISLETTRLRKACNRLPEAQYESSRSPSQRLELPLCRGTEVTEVTCNILHADGPDFLLRGCLFFPLSTQIKVNRRRDDQRQHHRDQNSANDRDGQRLQHL